MDRIRSGISLDPKEILATLALHKAMELPVAFLALQSYTKLVETME